MNYTLEQFHSIRFNLREVLVRHPVYKYRGVAWRKICALTHTLFKNTLHEHFPRDPQVTGKATRIMLSTVSYIIIHSLTLSMHARKEPQTCTHINLIKHARVPDKGNRSGWCTGNPVVTCRRLWQHTKLKGWYGLVSLCIDTVS